MFNYVNFLLKILCLKVFVILKNRNVNGCVQLLLKTLGLAMHAGKPEALYSSTLKMNDCKQIDIPGTMSLSHSFFYFLLLVVYLSLFHSFITYSAYSTFLFFFLRKREMRENINNEAG